MTQPSQQLSISASISILLFSDSRRRRLLDKQPTSKSAMVLSLRTTPLVHRTREQPRLVRPRRGHALFYEYFWHNMAPNLNTLVYTSTKR